MAIVMEAIPSCLSLNKPHSV